MLVTFQVPLQLQHLHAKLLILCALLVEGPLHFEQSLPANGLASYCSDGRGISVIVVHLSKTVVFKGPNFEILLTPSKGLMGWNLVFPNMIPNY